jgi:hypothetical protein
MNPVPFFDRPFLLDCNFVHDSAHVSSFYADRVDEFRLAICSRKVDLGLSGPCNMDMGRFMILRVYDKTKAKGAMDNNPVA